MFVYLLCLCIYCVCVSIVFVYPLCVPPQFFCILHLLIWSYLNTWISFGINHVAWVKFINKLELYWTLLNWILSNWTELNLIEHNLTELNWIEIKWIELNWIEKQSACRQQELLRDLNLCTFSSPRPDRKGRERRSSWERRRWRWASRSTTAWSPRWSPGPFWRSRPWRRSGGKGAETQSNELPHLTLMREAGVAGGV